ncbi:uncharacterized protein LOC120358058 [Solenopsis invicta]|uniref:uncharacterized protein LOC120358058 n=1 Tax=Solenopsis invicta TaxID=13686 RepID=UPI00193D8ACD|nr:uncharacterized protein LOC120358058 [Solenopsis invicta]
MLERGTRRLLDIDRYDHHSRRAGYRSYGIPQFGRRHARDPFTQVEGHKYSMADTARGDDQETWMTRRGSNEAVSRLVPWQLRANHRAERNAFVADVVILFSDWRSMVRSVVG